jgi:hypothetical protein
MRNFNNNTELEIITRTLLCNGYEINKVDRKHNYIIFYCTKFDDFGIKVSYLICIAETKMDTNSLKAITKIAEINKRYLLVIQEKAISDQIVLNKKKFLEKMGGPMLKNAPLNEKYSVILDKLGYNELPEKISGKANELFEDYVYQGLSYIFGNRVIKYGAERRFEDVADGIGFTSQNIVIIYDAKAYSKGYKFNKNAIRTFADYVNQFNQKYSPKLGRIHSFLVISGSFVDSESSLKKRDEELYKYCQTRLCCLKAKDLGVIVQKLTQNVNFITKIDWAKLFSKNILTASAFNSEFSRIKKDKIVRG